MPRILALIAAAAFLAAPLAAAAQEAKPAEPAAPPAAPPGPAPAAKSGGVTVTPYGFVLLNAFWDDATFGTKDYPGQVSRTQEGGAFLMSARQSRVGVRLTWDDEAGFTGAKLTGVVEFDFKGGQISGTTVNTAAPSTAWYNGLMRLRLAYGQADWKVGPGRVFVGFGQEYGLVNPLFATSLAWVADPLFWQSGNLWRRSPQIRAGYSGDYDGFLASLQLAMLSPADASSPVDFGAGNRSRRPDLEGRLSLGYRRQNTKLAEVGVGYHTGARRYPAAPPYPQTDFTATLVGVDAEVNVLQYATLKGEWYSGEGTDDTYNGTVLAVNAATSPTKLVRSSGFWAQLVLKPFEILHLHVGYGSGEGDRDDLPASAGTPAAPPRQKNTQLAAGIIFNAGRYWKFGLEGIRVETTYMDGLTVKGDQLALSSKLDF